MRSSVTFKLSAGSLISVSRTRAGVVRGHRRAARVSRAGAKVTRLALHLDARVANAALEVLPSERCELHSDWRC